jgi:hypothetical protein
VLVRTKPYTPVDEQQQQQRGRLLLIGAHGGVHTVSPLSSCP